MQSTGTMIIDVATTSVEAPARSAWWLIRRRPTLAVQFLIASLIVLVAGMAVIGSWVGAQIEAGVLDHDGATAAFLVDSVISPRLQVLAAKTRLDDADIAQIDWLMDATLRGRRVVEVKIWSTDGTVLYSRRNPPLIGQHFGVDEDLGQALRGEVNANISDLQDAENEYERHDFSRLLQVYVPIHHNSDGHIIGVTEFYQPTDDLDADINAARSRSWLVVGVVTAGAYLLLAGIVKRGSDTIVRQAGLLRRQFGELCMLHDRVRQAAVRTTALNEQALRRISADLHDGPGQTLALALLRLDNLGKPGNGEIGSDFGVVHGALREAMAELRAISATLRTPELEPLSVIEVAERAVDMHRRRTAAEVELHTMAVPEQAPLAIKIALLRTLQEALSNATRHGRATEPIEVELRTEGESLQMTVTDHGRGFDLAQAQQGDCLGLVGMRERAELLGGTFDIRSRPGAGTLVHTAWPLAAREEPWSNQSESS